MIRKMIAIILIVIGIFLSVIGILGWMNIAGIAGLITAILFWIAGGAIGLAIYVTKKKRQEEEAIWQGHLNMVAMAERTIERWNSTGEVCRKEVNKNVEEDI